MIFSWLGLRVIGATTSISLILLWLTPYIRKFEVRWRQNRFFSPSRQISLPFEDRINQWLQSCYVTMNAKQWYFLLFGSLFLSGIFYVVIPSIGFVTLGAGSYFTISIILYPFQKRKKTVITIEQQVRHTKQILAKLYERNVPLNEMLSVVFDRLPEGIYKSMMKQAITRTYTTDTLSEAISWLSNQIQVPSLQFLATTLIQSSRYANLPLGKRLSDMAKKDREKLLITFDKTAEQKKMRALIDGGTFIALPLIALLTIIVFYYVFKNFQVINQL